MTTINLKKNTDQDPKPLINPILQANNTDPFKEDLLPFSEFKNSIQPDPIEIIGSKPNHKSKNLKSRFWIVGVLFSIFANLLLISLFAVVILKIFVFQQVEVDGRSMLPNFNDHDYLLMNSIDKNFQRGQVVALYSNDKFAYKATHDLNIWDSYFARFDCKNPRIEAECNAKFFLKRVIGLPEEEIEVANGDVIIYNQANPSGAVLKEDYIPEATKNAMKKTNYHFAKTKIPSGKYFVMGDNRTDSTDSRVIGAVADYAIFGKHSYRVGNFVNNKANAFESGKLFELPKYEFLPVPEVDKLLMSK